MHAHSHDNARHCRWCVKRVVHEPTRTPPSRGLSRYHQVGRDVPFRAIQLTSYELLRTLLRTWRRRQHAGVATKRGDDISGVPVGRARGGAAAAAGGDGEYAALSAGDAALLGGLAGAISATFTCPLVCCCCSRERSHRAPSQRRTYWGSAGRVVFRDAASEGRLRCRLMLLVPGGFCLVVRATLVSTDDRFFHRIKRIPQLSMH